MREAKAEQLAAIDIASIEVGEQSVRYDPEDERIVEFAADIARRGLLQPIGVQRLPGDRYQLLWGGRRLAAHQRLRLTKILARIFEPGGDSIKTIALIENLQRVQMSLAEECDAVAHLHLVEDLSPDQICIRLSKSRDWVMRRLAIPGFPDDLRERVYDGSISLGAAEEIASIEDAGARAYVLNQATLTKASIAEVREMVRAARQIAAADEAIEAGVAVARSTVAPAPLLMHCARCGQPTPLEQLVLVRIHSGECPDPNGNPADDAAAPQEENVHGRVTRLVSRGAN